MGRPSFLTHSIPKSKIKLVIKTCTLCERYRQRLLFLRCCGDYVCARCFSIHYADDNEGYRCPLPSCPDRSNYESSSDDEDEEEQRILSSSE